ncbi:hypothetical protein B7463_g34, partial [Scytalidium lignicola]
MLQRLLLNEGWKFKQASSLNNSTASSFLPVAQFPTVQFIDLLHHKLIPDPYIDCNELQCLWVNDADWTYRTENVPAVTLTQSSRAVLVFDGLDTIVDVYLNDRHILSGNNMHIAYRVDVTDILRGRKDESILELRFSNAPAYAKKEMKRIGYKGNMTDVHFGGPERLFNIYLETYESQIGELLVTQEVSEDLEIAEITIKSTVEYPTQDQEVEIQILDPEGTIVETRQTKLSQEGKFQVILRLSQPKLWYPFTYGDQPLYTVKAILSGRDEKIQTLGLRRLKLLQHPLKHAEGTSFLFEVNGHRIFCGGSCWIPADFMLPRISRERYEAWLLAVKNGNQVMIRVWGGGIVESDTFYEICDREGILVWQDFLFACGNYPASDDFIANIKNEAEQQVKRVGHHPSLAIWAGNNEDYMLAERWGWEYDPKDEKGPWDKTDFPARIIYEHVLPEICERLAGSVPYWRSSPYGGAFSNYTTVGDTHIWDVWHDKMAPYQEYKAYTSRFVSEFGFESAPDLRTLHKAITNPKERHWQSRTFDAHDKGPGHQRRYGMYSGENFRFKMNPLEDFVYSTQFLQAEAMKYAYNHWRREFRGPGEENCSGILVWQLNDIWPGTSWALVDVDLHRKPSFYITKRALAKVVVELEAVLQLRAFDIESGKGVILPSKDTKLTLKPNQTTEITKIDIPQAETMVIAAYLNDAKTGEQLARWISWPEPLKFVHFAEDLKVESRVEGNNVILKSNVPVTGVVVSVPIEEGDDAVFDDNFIDLVPGEAVKIGVTGLNGRKLKTRFLCDWEYDGRL